MDTFTFSCALDKNLPETERGALHIEQDDEHIGLGVYLGSKALGAVYLTPEHTADLAALLGKLSGLYDETLATPDRPPAYARLVAAVMVGTVTVALIVLTVAGVAAAIRWMA